MRTALQYLVLRPLAAVDDGPLATDADGVATDISGGRRPHRAGAEEDDGGLERLDGCAGEAAGVTHGADAARCGRCIRSKSSWSVCSGRRTDDERKMSGGASTRCAEEQIRYAP